MSERGRDITPTQPVQAIATRPTLAQMVQRGEVVIPAGRRVYVGIDSTKVSEGGVINASGVLVAMNEQWAFMTDEEGEHVRLIAVSSIISLSTDPTDRPKRRSYVVGTEEELRRRGHIR